MLIVITGTPGTGKTASAELLGKKIRARTVHLREFVKGRKLASGFDEKSGSDIVNLKLLEKELKKELTKPKAGKPKPKTIVEGHLACEIPLPADFVFVLRCNPTELEKRMRKRKYPEEKVRENLLAEMLDYCTQKAEANCPGAKIVEMETGGKSAAQTADAMAGIVAGKKIRKEKISYAKELKKFLGLS